MIFSVKKSKCKERGAILVVTLVVIIALIMMGSLAIMITVTESNISRNHKMAKEVFYMADGGYPLAVKIIEDIMSNKTASYAGFVIEENLTNEVMDYHQDDTSLNDKDEDSPNNSPDITTTLLQQTLNIDIDRTNTTLIYGGSAEFGAGGENIGVGGKASKKVLFEIASQGRMRSGALSRVVTVYRGIL
jgi:Tfp pilus assembly protein PilX